MQIVVAMDEARGIGMGNALPWRLPGDMAFFRRLTTEAPSGKQNAVIMGRKTYESIPDKFRPLKGRLNVVMTRDPALALPQGVLRAASLDDALARVAQMAGVDATFVTGGAQVYALALAHPACRRLHITRVHATFPCDARFPELDDRFRLVTRDGPHHDNGVRYTFETYERT